ncbi:type VI secretion system tube protein Hcp [Halomonas sp. M4R5S39]|uniref:Type VI secretion system tube protein Hcp n=2 Tax=Halomonadaceae TaxID=28256 RepID=A0A2N7TFS8_9GAMM|nr:type VI secretion system tube protein Hcp [Halomonas kalidii]PMR67015.1 type VI secretion system tube protein Hcp [Halomonas heilongjiangensis]PXX88069.1 type VI secretion system tube protein Hcp [Halomonas heilongjiangensis]
MAVDMFLKLEGIDGESTDHAHEDEIDVLSWSWGVSNSGTMHIARGGGAGKASFQDVQVVKYVDKATAGLLQAVATGKHVPSGTLTIRKAGGDEPVEYLVIELKSVLISSYQTGGSQGEERLTESVTLNFEEFKVNYTPQDNDGSALAAVDFGYNIAKSEAA